MLFDEGDAGLLTHYIIKKLESEGVDADADVLAEYVIALLKTDDTLETAKKNSLENLQDFIGDYAPAFVDDVFNALVTKSYDPSKPQVKIPTAPATQPVQRANLDPPQQLRQPKKRSFHDYDREESQNGRTLQSSERSVKQPRRGGRGGFDQRGGRQQYQAHQLQGQGFPPLSLPVPPLGMPPYDPNDPMAQMQAMQHIMAQMMSGMPPPNSDQRCVDFDTLGYCAKGASCPFEHGSDKYVVPVNHDEYDPNVASLAQIQPSRTGTVNTSPSVRGRGPHRGRGHHHNFRGGGKRAGFSHQGPNHDRSVTAVVVEQIPEEKFDEQTVHNFFSQFGTIEEITMQPYKRLAVVKYNSHEAAQAAYNSPKVVFDNRFVKVYWYKPDNPKLASNDHEPSRPTEIEVVQQEPDIDQEEVVRRQEEAQRKHEEQQRKRAEAEGKKKELEEKTKAIEAERMAMMEKLAKKTGGNLVSQVETSQPKDNEKTAALRAQLANLEAEAKTLGIDPVATSTTSLNSPSAPYRGRGGFRSRARGRAEYRQSFRGGWSGGRGGAVMRLDNRPKTVCVAFREGVYEDHDETLRQWFLFNGPESATLSKHPGRADAALVVFPERYLGEAFMSAQNFSLANKVNLSWYTGATTGSQDVEMKSAASTEDQEAHEPTNGRGLDAYDVAEDDDRWG